MCVAFSIVIISVPSYHFSFISTQHECILWAKTDTHTLCHIVINFHWVCLFLSELDHCALNTDPLMIILLTRNLLEVRKSTLHTELKFIQKKEITHINDCNWSHSFYVNLSRWMNLRLRVYLSQWAKQVTDLVFYK